MENAGSQEEMSDLAVELAANLRQSCYDDVRNAWILHWVAGG